MSKAFYIFVAYSESQMSKTSKTSKSVLLICIYLVNIDHKCDQKFCGFVVQMFLNFSAKISRSHADV